jgi:hypothetical protein
MDTDLLLADFLLEAENWLARCATTDPEAERLLRRCRALSKLPMVEAGRALSRRIGREGPPRWICRRCGNPRRRSECLSCGNSEVLTDERRTPGVVR